MFTPSQTSNFSFTPPESPSPNLQTLLAYRDGLNDWDIDKIAPLFDESLEHHILPKSLGRPVLNKRQYLTYFTKIMPLFKTFHLTLHEVIEAGDVITVHGSSVGESITGAPYNNETMVVLHFGVPDDGDFELPRMTMVKEFVDSSSVLKFFTEERAKTASVSSNESV